MTDARQWHGESVPETVDNWHCVHSDEIQLKYVLQGKEARITASREPDDEVTYIVALPSGSVISYTDLDAALTRLLGYMRRIDGPPWLRGQDVWTPEVSDE